MNTCPNLSSPEFKALLKTLQGDEDLAILLYNKYDGVIPKNILNAHASSFSSKRKGKAPKRRINQKMDIVVAAMKKVTDLIDFEPIKHVYSYAGKKLKSVTDTIDKFPAYEYTGVERDEYEKNSKLGSAMHKVMEDIINGVDKEQMDKSFTTEENFDKFYNAIEKIVERIKQDGTVVSEIRIGNTKNAIAGTIDIAVFRKDGSVDIYDLKTSIHSTENKALYRNNYKGKASKEDKHGLQLATYAKMLEMGDSELGMMKLRIGTLTIIPFNITIEGDMVSDITEETPIPLSYSKYESETSLTLPNQPIYEEKVEMDDAKEIFYRTFHKSLESWAEANYSWYRKDTLQKELDELVKKKDEAEFSPDFKGDRDATIKELEKKIASFTENRARLEEGYNAYKEAFARLEQFYANLNIDEITDVDVLKKYLNDFAHFDPQAKRKLDRLQKHLIKKIIDLQVQVIKNKHEDFEFDVSTSKDLKERDYFLKALSDFSEEFPEMQYFAKEYESTYIKMLEERNAMLKKYEAVGKKVVQEYNKKNGVVGNVIDFLNPLVSNAKYFEFMDAGKGKAVTKKDAKYQQLTKAQQEFVDIVEELNKQYESQITQGNGNVDLSRLIKVERTFGENWKEDGLFRAFANYIGSDNYKQRAIRIKDEKGNIRSYGEIEAEIQANIASKKISKISGLVEIAKLKRKAIKQIDTGKHSDGEKFNLHDRSEFEINAYGQLRSKFHHKQGNINYTKDFYRAYMEMFTEMNFIKHMEPVLPMIEALEVYNQTTADGSERKNMLKYLEVFKKGNILREQMSVAGRDVDSFIRFFRKLTHLRVMAFNIPASVFNVIIGKYNQYRGDLLPSFGKGEKRYWGDMKKTRAIIEKYQAVSIDFDYNPANHVGSFFDMLMFGATRLGEHYIQGAGVVGQMKEEWDWIDENGNVTDKDGKTIDKKGNAQEIEKREAILRDKMQEYKKKVRDIQGKYSDEDKRGFSHFEVGRAIMQFKVWMPDAINDRFSKKYIDIHGNVRQGTFNYLFKQGFSDLKYQLLHPNKDFWTSDKPNDVLLRRNIRSFVAFTSMLALYAAVADDDDEESKWIADKLNKVITDMSFGLNLDGAEATLKSPIPFFNTMMKSLEAVESVIFLQENRNGFTAPKKVLNMLPYKNLVETPIKIAEDYLDE